MQDIDIRPLKTQADFAACIALQYETWGPDLKDAVPGIILKISQRIGGVAAGAFAKDGTLLGFVFGLTGVENGQTVHWSDMLAVRPEARNRGVGRRLKEFQRAEVARVGGRVIYWTFDPLVARNANLNFNVFGVRTVEYVRDMYGDDTGSALHRGIGTDRLVVSWPVADFELSRRRQKIAVAGASDSLRIAPIVGDIGDSDRENCISEVSNREIRELRLAVPQDISLLQSTDMRSAIRWRASTRVAFEVAFAFGYQVDGFAMETGQERAYYLLSRN